MLKSSGSICVYLHNTFVWFSVRSFLVFFHQIICNKQHCSELCIQVYDVSPFMDDHPGGDEVLLSGTGNSENYNPFYIYLSLW